MNHITIQKMIVHQVDHRNYKAARLSDIESPLNPDARRFLLSHINLNREHRYTRSAVFREVPDGEPNLKELCDGLAADPGEFVPQSRAIATHLFSTMQSDQRISPGDLVVCTFTEDEDEKAVWVALLKMDPEAGFVGERITTQEGKVQTVLKQVDAVLPTGDLQKCAFILPASQRQDGLHLRVLDQQAARYGVSRLVASFFLVNFLQCDVVINPADQTKAFLYGSQEWVETRRGIWPDADINRFNQAAGEALQNEQIDLTEYAKTVIGPSGEQDEYLGYMRKQGIRDLTFQPDPEVRTRLTQYVWFEGDDGLKIRINSDAIGAGKTLDPREDPNTNTWTVTIRTSNWIRKSRGRL
jgi:nucleoid-associated protein YejK